MGLNDQALFGATIEYGYAWAWCGSDDPVPIHRIEVRSRIDGPVEVSPTACPCSNLRRYESDGHNVLVAELRSPAQVTLSAEAKRPGDGVVTIVGLGEGLGLGRASDELFVSVR